MAEAKRTYTEVSERYVIVQWSFPCGICVHVSRSRSKYRSSLLRSTLVMVFLLLQALAVSIRRTLIQPLKSAEKRFRDIACECAVVSGAAQQEFAGHARSRGISFLSSCPDPVHVLSPRSGGYDINEGGFLWMAAPKRRTSHSKKRMRMTHKWLKPIQNYTFCQTCGNPKLLNVLCGYCFKNTMRKTAEYRNKKEEFRMKRASSQLQIQALDNDTDRNSQPV